MRWLVPQWWKCIPRWSNYSGRLDRPFFIMMFLINTGDYRQDWSVWVNGADRLEKDNGSVKSRNFLVHEHLRKFPDWNKIKTVMISLWITLYFYYSIDYESFKVLCCELCLFSWVNFSSLMRTKGLIKVFKQLRCLDP